MTTQNLTPTHQAVQEYYGKLAQEAASCCSQPADSNSASCCGASAKEETQSMLYPADVLTGIPDDIADFSAGSGDPISLAKLKPGETVLDLGSGGGLDCFLAARQVGESGRVIGVDMTPEMLARARAGAQRLKLSNVEFREGFLESLPVEDASIDVVISNCVINLSPDKPRVLREMFRTLKPGGRIAISDMVANRPLSEADRSDKEKWCMCTSGAFHEKEFAAELSKAGFVDVQLAPNIDVILKAVENGQANVLRGKSREQVAAELENRGNMNQTMVIPFMITATRPNE